MPDKSQVISAHQQHPNWTSRQIAEFILGQEAKDRARLESVNGSVRRTAQRNGLQLSRHPIKPKPARKSRADGIWALGVAARAAGLSVADINEIATIID